jgi:hypothetical protein
VALPAADELFIPPGADNYGEPPVDVGPLYIPTDFYEVQAINQTQRYPSDGRIINTLDVSFLVSGVPGIHNILIDNYAFTHADPIEYLYERSYLLKAAMALPEQLPPFDYGQLAQPGPIVTLNPVVATTANGLGAVQWSGSVNPRGQAATATLEVTALGDADPTLVSGTYTIGATDTYVPLADVLGPLDPGKYIVTLTANNGFAVVPSMERVLTIP